jgi:hypothetical protein
VAGGMEASSPHHLRRVAPALDRMNQNAGETPALPVKTTRPRKHERQAWLDSARRWTRRVERPGGRKDRMGLTRRASRGVRIERREVRVRCLCSQTTPRDTPATRRETGTPPPWQRAVFLGSRLRDAVRERHHGPGAQGPGRKSGASPCYFKPSMNAFISRSTSTSLEKKI